MCPGGIVQNYERMPDGNRSKLGAELKKRHDSDKNVLLCDADQTTTNTSALHAQPKGSIPVNTNTTGMAILVGSFLHQGANV